MTAPKIDTSREVVERLLAKRLENRCAVPCADPRFESFCPICEPRVEGDEMIRALLDERDNARREAFEEAAKIAQTLPVFAFDGPHMTANKIATAIRAKMQEG